MFKYFICMLILIVQVASVPVDPDQAVLDKFFQIFDKSAEENSIYILDQAYADTSGQCALALQIRNANMGSWDFTEKRCVVLSTNTGPANIFRSNGFAKNVVYTIPDFFSTGVESAEIVDKTPGLKEQMMNDCDILSLQNTPVGLNYFKFRFKVNKKAILLFRQRA